MERGEDEEDANRCCRRNVKKEVSEEEAVKMWRIF